MAKKMIIKGVGTFMAKRLAKDGGTEVITLGTLQDLRITMNVDIEDIFGGDGLFAIDTLVRNKSIEITATDAKFDLDAVQLMMGSTVHEQVDDYLWVLGEQQTAIAEDVNAYVEPEFADTLYAIPEFSVRVKDANKLLKEVKYVEGNPLKEDEFAFDEETNRIYVPAKLANADLVLNYKRREVVDKADLLTNEVPFPVHVVHHGSYLQKDGTYAGIETELFSCRARGSFSIDAARASASSSAVSLIVIDPERADGKLGTIKRYNSTKRV